MRRYSGGCKLQKAALWLHIFKIMRQKAVCTINACHIGHAHGSKQRLWQQYSLRPRMKNAAGKQKRRTIFGRSQFPPADAKRRPLESVAEFLARRSFQVYTYTYAYTYAYAYANVYAYAHAHAHARTHTHTHPHPHPHPRTRTRTLTRTRARKHTHTHTYLERLLLQTRDCTERA